MDTTILHSLRTGIVIPAHPLALDASRKLDEHRQRRLTRYYLAAGAGGLAVGVHTTQFAIRDPRVGLYETVLRLAAEEIASAGREASLVKVAGICGPTGQALQEAAIARRYGYHLGLLSMGGLEGYSEEQLLDHARAIGESIPIFGFYLQPAAGGRRLSYAFWRAFAEIPAVGAIKVAAFNRYATLDVVRAVCSSSRRDEITLYTGNDDNILADLLTPYRFSIGGQRVEKRFAGGLLGHWAVWTECAVRLLAAVQAFRKEPLRVTDTGQPAADDWLAMGAAVTDMNAALFDAANGFKGCIPGVHEVLRRQGLLAGRWCLDPSEELSPGQAEELTRICNDHPHLTDDAFVHTFLENDK